MATFPNDSATSDAQVPEASRGSLQMLFQQLARASAVGLIDLRVPETGEAVHARDGAADLQPMQTSNGHDKSLARPHEAVSTRGQPSICAACGIAC